MGVQERRQRDFERREAELLEAALAMLNHDRWLAVTIDQIAEAAEIGKGTVYKHFTSKDEMYARLALSFHRRLLQDLAAVDGNGDPEAALRRACGVLVQSYLEASPYQRVVAYCARADFRRLLPDSLRLAFDQVEEAVVNDLTRLIERGQAAGRWTDHPAREHAVAILALLAGATALARVGTLEGLEIEGCRALAVEGAMAILGRQERGEGRRPRTITGARA